MHYGCHRLTTGYAFLCAGAAAVVTFAGGHGFDAHLRGPSFVLEPPSRIEFSNSSGAWLDCTASGSPPPNIDWSTTDGHPVNDVSGVRTVLSNGTLVLLPFPAAAYRQDVHSAAYRCVASNSVGRVLSRDVQVRAGEDIGEPCRLERRLTFFRAIARNAVAISRRALRLFSPKVISIARVESRRLERFGRSRLRDIIVTLLL